MGHGQMLRVIKVGRWLARPRTAGLVGPDPGNAESSLVIRSGAGLTGAVPPILPEVLPGADHADPAGNRDCRRSGRNRPGGSGPSSGAPALRLHLVMIAPGTRGHPHRHDRQRTAVYMVSGEAAVWHGPGFTQRVAVRAGDYLDVPPGTPHLLVNRGDVTAIAVVAAVDPAADTVLADTVLVDTVPVLVDTVPVELPEQLTGLLRLPVGSE